MECDPLLARRPAGTGRGTREYLSRLPIADQLADRVARAIGSWRFIIVQVVAVAAWVLVNTLHGWPHWDEYPFILLNLMFSVQAAFTGPILQLTSNRQNQIDHEMAARDDALLRRIDALLEYHGVEKPV